MSVKRERPVSLQLFGSEPELLAEIAALLEPGPYDIIDFNMGLSCAQGGQQS